MEQENTNVQKDKIKNKPLIIIILFLILVAVIILLAKIIIDIRNEQNKFPEIITIDYNDDSEPGSRIVVDLNSTTKLLKVKTEKYCSAIDCETKYDNYEITITEEELSLIKKYYLSDKYREENMALIFELIVQDEKNFYENDENAYLKSEDLNKDGIVTYRESGNNLLKTLTK